MKKLADFGVESEMMEASAIFVARMKAERLGVKSRPIAARPERYAAFTPHEDDSIRALRRDGMSYAQIGTVLGRETASIGRRIQRLGLVRSSQ